MTVLCLFCQLLRNFYVIMARVPDVCFAGMLYIG